MQPNYRINDILFPGQNWVKAQPANARGQRVKRWSRVEATLSKSTSPIAPIFLSNVRSLRSKTDEFLCQLRTKRDCKDYSIFCFIKITLYFAFATIPDSAV